MEAAKNRRAPDPVRLAPGTPGRRSGISLVNGVWPLSEAGPTPQPEGARGNGSCSAYPLKYLAPYIFRVAISNRRILKIEDGQVTFSNKESATDQVKFSTIPSEEFIRRFLQHVLPDHFVKVRYYGLLSPANRRLLEKVRELLGASPIDNSTSTQSQRDNEPSAAPRCPTCGSILKLIQRLKPQSRWPP